MATLDQITQLGGSARCVVDLGYSTLQSAETLIEMTRVVCGLEPSIVFANAFFQIARGDIFAKALGAAIEPLGGGLPVVVRLSGNGSAEGSVILRKCTRLVTSQMSEACEVAVQLSSLASKG
jgi:succinyl-CoA synthetase beta subunit